MCDMEAKDCHEIAGWSLLEVLRSSEVSNDPDLKAGGMRGVVSCTACCSRTVATAGTCSEMDDTVLYVARQMVRAKLYSLNIQYTNLHN